MAVYNNRAEGRRPPRRGRTDRESDPVFGEIRDEDSISLGQRLSPREAGNRQRQRGRAYLPLERQNER
jgi:hypothetical protein